MNVTIETDERGRAVACKWASGDGVARLRHEAEVLEAARHPGVVELLDVRFDGSSASLRLAAAPGPSLDRCPALTGDEAAGVVAAVAATVADLHAAGIVHRAIEAAHVVLDGDGRPLLCGFADAVVVGAAAGAATADSGEEGEARDADAAVDVAALGALLLELAGAAPPVAGRPDPRAEVLAAIASWASSPDPASRPSAGDLAAAIATRVPAARLPRPADLAARGQADGGDGAVLGRLLECAGVSDDGPRGQRGTRGGRRRAAPVAAVAVAAAVITLAGFASGMSGGPPPAAPPVTGRAVLSSTTTTTTTTTADRVQATQVWPGTPSSTTTPTTGAGAVAVDCPPAEAELRADVDGDGCVEPLTYAAGVLRAGSARWAVGGEGDRVATGDWWCRGEGRATLAVLRAADRSVWVFEGWPAEAGAKVVAQGWGAVAGATGLRAVPGSGGCAVLRVERAGQPPVTLAPPRSGR